MAEAAPRTSPITIYEHRSTETDPATRGRLFGLAWGAQINQAFGEYEQMFAALEIGDDQVRRVCAESLEMTRQYTPDIAAELLGIGAAAELEPWQMMAISARTEVLALAPPAQECSAAIYLPADGSAPRTVQTWDWRPCVAAEAVIHVLPGPDGTRIVTFAEFGQAAKIGVNSRGLAVHFNILSHDQDGSRAGVPVHVLTRHILDRAATIEEAEQIAASVPLAASTVLTMAAMTPQPRAACLELTPVGVARVDGQTGQVLSHTNHFLDPGLGAGEKPKIGSTSPARLAFLDQHTEQIAITDPVERVLTLGAQTPIPICVRADPGLPAHRNVETKATFTLDPVATSIGFHPGGPRDVRRETWRTVAAESADHSSVRA